MSTGRAFRQRSALRVWEGQFGPNMTPMVDVVLVILIFFMASSAILGVEWFLRVSIPGEGGPGPAAPDPLALPPARFEIVLRVDADGRTLATGLGLQDVAPEALAPALAELAREAGPDGAEVIVRPGPQVPYDDVVRIHDLCEAAGLARVGLSAAAPAGAPASPSPGPPPGE